MAGGAGGFGLAGVGIVAGGAAKVAFLEAGALAEGDGLVADVPGVLPVDVFAGLGGLAMAGAAEVVEAGGVEDFGAEELGVVGSGAVAGLALDAEFGGLNARLACEREFTGGVALEAAEDLGAGVEDAVFDAVGVSVAGGESFRVRAGVVGEAVFEVVVGVEAGDGGGGLATGTEGPDVSAAGEGIGMGRAFLGGGLGLVTFGAGRRARELGGGGRESDAKNDEGQPSGHIVAFHADSVRAYAADAAWACRSWRCA